MFIVSGMCDLHMERRAVLHDAQYPALSRLHLTKTEAPHPSKRR